MKKTILLFAPVIALTAFTLFPHNLVGTWTSGNVNSKIILAFHADGKFIVTVNGALENQGAYSFKQDTFTMYDANCGKDIQGKYKITFFTADSAAFTLISDPCKDRAGEIDGGRIKRIK